MALTRDPWKRGTVGGRTHDGSLGKGCHLGTFYRHHLNPRSNNPGTTLGSEVARRQRKLYWENGEWTWCTDLYSCLPLWFSDSESLGQFSDNGNTFHGSMRSGLPVACLSSCSAQTPLVFLDGPSRLAQMHFKAQCSLDSLSPAPSDGPSLPAFLKEYLKS